MEPPKRRGVDYTKVLVRLERPRPRGHGALRSIGVSSYFSPILRRSGGKLLAIGLKTHPRCNDGKAFLQKYQQIENPHPPTNLGQRFLAAGK